MHMRKCALSILLCSATTLLLAACGGPTDSSPTEASREITSKSPIESTFDSTQATETLSSSFDTSLIGLTFASGDYEYTVQENGTVYIAGYTGNDANVTIPSELDGYQVTGISTSAFQTNQSIVTLVVPGTVKEIGEKAFCNCPNLTSVTLEDGVQILGTSAFMSCDNISELSITSSVSKVGEYAWSQSKMIQRSSNGLIYVGNVVIDIADDFDGHVVFEDDTTGIADGAMKKIEGSNNETGRLILDETVTFPDGIQYIGSGAFANQIDVEYYRVPPSVTEIGSYAIQFEYVNYSYGLYNDNEIRKIYGVAGSIAEQYAITNGLNFVITTR